MGISEVTEKILRVQYYRCHKTGNYSPMLACEKHSAVATYGKDICMGCKEWKTPEKNRTLNIWKEEK